MANVARRAAAYDDLVALPENVVGEIIHGELITSPRPASPHTLAKSILGFEITGPFHRGRGGPGGWVILFEPELHLGPHVLVPDIAGWRRTRMPEMPSAPAFELAPDWVCEIVSPSTEAIDRADKLPIYASHAVSHTWLVDPLTRTLEVFRLVASNWQLAGVWRDDARVRAEPFDAIELELGALWAR